MDLFRLSKMTYLGICMYFPSFYIKQSKCYKSGFKPVKNQTSDRVYELQATTVGTNYITAALVSGVLLGMASTQKELLGADKLQIIRLHLSDFESSSINAILPRRVLSNRISHLAIRIYPFWVRKSDQAAQMTSTA